MAGQPFTLQRLAWRDAHLGTIELPGGTLKMVQSFGSGLARRASDEAGLVWAIGDRGPNLKIETLVERYGAAHLEHLGALPGAKVMPRPDIGPRLAKLRVSSDQVELIASFPIIDAQGKAVSGLPMPGSEHAANEPALTLSGDAMEGDPSGLDTEGIVALDNGTFVLSEEFGPSLLVVDGTGRVLVRHLPDGSAPAWARYPLCTGLPAIALKRQLNRGFEAIAASADQKWLFVAFQSSLAHPNREAHEQARHVRLWRLKTETMKVVAQYLYPLDRPETFLLDNAKRSIGWSDLKISELVCLPTGDLLVLERGSATTKIYRVHPDEESALPPEDLNAATRPTVEERSAAGERLPCLAKELLFTSDHAPEMSADLEGMVVLSPTELLLVTDNDFGVEGAETAFWRITFHEPLLA